MFSALFCQSTASSSSSISLTRTPPMIPTKLLRRLKHNFRPSSSIEYTGCPAPNLGDQAVFRAVNRVFRGVTVAFPKYPGGLFGPLARWEYRQRRLASMLGGGTIIGAPPWSTGMASQFEQSLKR